MTPNYRIPVAESYASALGHAIYSFAYLQWGIVYLTDKLWSGYVTVGSNNSADDVAADFSGASTNTSLPLAPEIRQRLSVLASNFRDLVAQRDDLVRDTPATAPDGDQELISRVGGSPYKWDEAGIVNFAQKCEAAAIEASDLYYNHLPSAPAATVTSS